MIKKLIPLTLVLILASCDPATTSALEEAWKSYESKDYTAAYSQFNTIAQNDVAEAYVGLGWSAMRLDSLNEAKTYFAHIATDSLIDAYAGWGIVDNLTNDFVFAQKHAELVLMKDDTYQFSHDISVDYKDILWNLAQSFYHQGQYAQCLLQIQKLDASFNDASAAALLQKLEDLSKSL